MAKDYYVGLDCGTDSVGWAATDPEYHLITATGKIKKDGKTKTVKRELQGVRLFNGADTAADRRVARSVRRRGERAKNRLKLLRMLFRDEISQVDPEFYQRLRESFYWQEDKKLQNNSKNTLFNDPNYTDKDYFKQYPTIWHLRKAIIEADGSQHFDIRLYFLAIQHILKHRGHFLIEGKFQAGSDFGKIFTQFKEAAEAAGYHIANNPESIEALIKAKMTKNDKKRELTKLLFVDKKDLAAGEESADFTQKGAKSLVALMVGGQAKVGEVFGLDTEDEKSVSFASAGFEDKIPELEAELGAENMALVLAAKQVYDYGVLINILRGNTYISEAMVANYEQHEKDLKEIKEVLRSDRQVYDEIFKTEVFDEKHPNYSSYIGKGYIEKSGRRQTKRIEQEDFNKYLEKVLEAHGAPSELLQRAQNRELLPKQRGFAKGTIPQQVHHQELERILEKLQKDFPSFAKVVPGEPEKCNTKAKKIAIVHSFRIPYYCGPLVKRSIDEKGNPVSGGKSQFSWGDREIEEIIYPWNFEQIVDLDARAKNFIRRMTNECTYLVGEEVLPKSSLLYQEYMVLNELNNLKLNGVRIDQELKQKLYERGFMSAQSGLSGNITLRALNRWAKSQAIIGASDELAGTSDTKYLPSLKTHQAFLRILGENYRKEFAAKDLEQAIEAITVLGEERKMLRRQLAKLLNLDEQDERIRKLAKLGGTFKDWGRLSSTFLNGIRAQVDGREMTIIEALHETTHNLMELRGSEYQFAQKVEEFNLNQAPKDQRVTYADVKALYCSPAVKRSVWQALQIVREIAKSQGRAPKKIFLEATRGDDKDQRSRRSPKNNQTLRRKEQLMEIYEKMRHDPETQKLLSQLDKQDDRSLQSKKLFLYFSQMGKCAYTGEPINLEEINNTQLYDIDHIYPRSKTKDDSITRNLVLVKAECNREKSDTYPLPQKFQTVHTQRLWLDLRKNNLITQEKYERLTRKTPLTADELGGFIARQLVETSQSVKAIRDLLVCEYPDAKVVLVKAGQVSDLRHQFASGMKDHDSGQYIVDPRPEFVKVRELNDLHHAKDAYLNIVVGNVMSMTFTDNPVRWVKEHKDSSYTINPIRLFRSTRVYRNRHGKDTDWPHTQGWNFQESIDVMSSVMQNNHVLITRKSYEESSELSNLQLVGKSDKNDDIMPIKQNQRLRQIEKYGGYNKIKGLYFELIERHNKKGQAERFVVSVPQIAKANSEKYLRKKYHDASIMSLRIKYQALIKVGGVFYTILGKTGARLSLAHNQQLFLPTKCMPYLKSVIEVANKKKAQKDKFVLDEKHDKVNSDENIELYNSLVAKTALLRKIPSLEKFTEKAQISGGAFAGLDAVKQALILVEMLKVFKCNGESADLSPVMKNANQAGTISIAMNITNQSSIYLINQSITGLYQEYINLKTVQPKINKQ